MHRNQTLLKAMIALAVVPFARTAYATPIIEMTRHSIDGGGVMRSARGTLRTGSCSETSCVPVFLTQSQRFPT